MKIIVVGCPGSGKSHFSRELAKKINYKIYHMDVLYWNPGWVATPYEEFLKKIQNIFEEDNFIMEGNYQKSLEYRLEKADCVFFLDMPEDVCLAQEEARRGKKRDDMPDYLIEEYDPEFIKFIKNYKFEGRVLTLELIKKYQNTKKIIIFTNIADENNYLENIKDEKDI